MVEVDMVKYEYHVSVHSHPDVLMAACNEMLRRGWQLQGGVSVACKTGTDVPKCIYAQAFVREVPREGDE